MHGQAVAKTDYICPAEGASENVDTFKGVPAHQGPLAGPEVLQKTKAINKHYGTICTRYTPLAYTAAHSDAHFRPLALLN